MITDREFIDMAAKGLEIEQEPLQPLADKLGMTIDEVIERLEGVGAAAGGLEAVSHCYQRAHPNGDPFCVYVMMHGRNEQTVDNTLAEIKKIEGVKGIEICQSVAELKKTSVSGVTTKL
jgi:DNA-binding Lrp family transcriptional regulator